MPVSVRTGLLGSGKTMLRNRLVRSRQSQRPFVVIIEFGAIDLDHDQLAEATDD
ncbi:GTP-binding protein [Sphingomonas sp. BK069]|uniref:GTP-binding protein n=1 Tax=Sphingomonas sp. BK069 TaxID=2586979 RepID=UPI00288BB0DA|nr:GTP-binding protein [Sphingomonas sp. BK069]